MKELIKSRLVLFFVTALFSSFATIYLVQESRSTELEQRAVALAEQLDAVSTTTTTVEIEAFSTTTSTTAPPPSTTTTTTVVEDEYAVDECGRGANYPQGWYTEATPQATPNDLMPNWKQCPKQYAAWATRQGAQGVSVSHCYYDTDGDFAWMWDDPAYTRYQEAQSGHRWACIGVDPLTWIEWYGEPPYNK